MTDQRLNWKFCPRCALPWPMLKPEDIRGKMIICDNCGERIPDIDGWMKDCAMYRERLDAANDKIEQMSRVLNRLHAKGGIVAYSEGEWLVIGGEDDS